MVSVWAVSSKLLCSLLLFGSSKYLYYTVSPNTQIEFLIPYSEQKWQLSGYFLSKKSKGELKTTLSFQGNMKITSQARGRWIESSATVNSHWH